MTSTNRQTRSRLGSSLTSLAAARSNIANNAPIRILHVGNIANNAYHNAKALNEAGLDCDVLCYDYYHIMGCPEWEDADFVGLIEDHFSPDWSKVDLKGFRRPPWFAQGPRYLATRYLLARRRGHLLQAGLLWRLMSISQRRRSQTPVALIRFLVRGFRYVRKQWFRIVWKIVPWLRHPMARINRIPRTEAPSRKIPTIGSTARSSFYQRVEELITLYDELFPERLDRLTPEDFEHYFADWPQWQKLFAEYDFIQAYSTDPILPMIAGVPYIAYEHGTIREIPFENNAVGRLTALSYALADAIIITNPDCRMAAERLGARNYRFIPHMIDRKYYDSKIWSGKPLPSDIRRPFLFLPSRHDWEVKGTRHLLEAFLEISKSHPDLQLVTSSWGTNLQESKDWLRAHGLEGRCVFLPPLHIHDFIRVVASATVLVDQFRYGVFGGISPTALALGIPLVTHLDYAQSEWCMEPPPCFSAHDTATCIEAILAALATDPEEYQRASLDWMKKNYWHETVVDRHLEIYTHLTGRERHSASRQDQIDDDQSSRASTCSEIAQKLAT